MCSSRSLNDLACEKCGEIWRREPGLVYPNCGRKDLDVCKVPIVEPVRGTQMAIQGFRTCAVASPAILDRGGPVSSGGRVNVCQLGPGVEKGQPPARCADKYGRLTLLGISDSNPCEAGNA